MHDLFYNIYLLQSIESSLLPVENQSAVKRTYTTEFYIDNNKLMMLIKEYYLAHLYDK